ncbi:capsid assembly scaffolding protein Gp46 family protein [Nocardia nova]|uniref:capsid assembly scaffolding protein Gp46 family protein n=1 Tax=Nocardia nova TaxID=37330 RepID=UPI00273A366A|nr:DUF4355 domain-containing protein [Nocardia nova]
MFDLPIHPVTGLRALGIGKRGPIWPQLGAAETEDPGEATEPAAEEAASSQDSDKDSAPSFQAITTQADLDRIIGRRVAQERSKYSGFDDLKAKASKYDELEEAKKTNEQRLSDQLTAAQKRVEELELDKLRNTVAADKGLPAKFARRLTGTTREELEADADDLLDSLPKPEPKVPLSQKPKESLRGGGRPDEEPEETDPRKLAAKIPR